MKTNKLKQMAELCEPEYEEYVLACEEDGVVPMDIFTYVITEQATKEEYQNDMLRDDALMDAENVSWKLSQGHKQKTI